MKTSFVVFSISFLASSYASANMITFDDLENGEVLSTQYSGVIISADNIHTGGDYAVAYDSNPASSNNNEDSDLEGPNWGNSNIANIDTMSFGNVLIIQENREDGKGTSTENCSFGICSYPDDEGRRAAGSLYFDFSSAIKSFGMDLIDVEDTEVGGGYAAFFYNSIGAEVASIGFGEFAGGAYDQGAVWGNNSVNRISPIDLSGYNDDITRVEIRLGGSSAIDNILYTVPEPATLSLIGLSVLGLRLSKKKR